MDVIYEQRIEQQTESALKELEQSCCRNIRVLPPETDRTRFVVRLSCRNHGAREFDVIIDASGKYESDDSLKTYIKQQIANAKKLY